MKKAIAFLTPTLAALLLAGCAASSGYQMADKTTKSIGTFHNDVVEVKKAVDASLAGLDQVTQTAAVDPRPAYETFSKSVDKLESARAKAGKRAQEIKATGAAYFEQWEKELLTITNPDIREAAEKRKAKLKETFAKVGPLMEDAKAKLDPFISDIKDVRTLLAQDLTVNGVDNAKSIIRKTRSSGSKVQSALDDLLEEMNAIAAALSAAKPPPPPAK
jgi:F0F1-type ATP synthase membrane subunit b/b'